MISFKGKHFPRDIILMAVHWYYTYSLRLRDIEELMREREVCVDHAIECIAMLRFIYHLPLRAAQGFVESIFKLAKINLKVPYYSTISRRLKSISLTLENRYAQKDVLNIAVDSTGLKVHGGGEWKVRQHGHSKRRTWRKLHLGVDTQSQDIVCAVLSSNDFKDNELIEDSLSQVKCKIKSFFGDGAYDAQNVYSYCKENKINPIVPPNHNAKIRQHGNFLQPMLVRDEHLPCIKAKGRKFWKKQSEYHQRLLVETVMFRFKMTFGATLRSRNFSNQVKEAFTKCNILNKFSELGLANSIKTYPKDCP